MMILEQGAPKIIKRSMEQRKILKRSTEQEKIPGSGGQKGSREHQKMKKEQEKR